MHLLSAHLITVYVPHSSYLNLSSPDKQCLFNRSGVLCGHCKKGLSAVFGSSQCKQCSNTYLLITIPTAIAGIVLVILMFILNLTVTNGTIISFIFYVNIINTNHSMLLPSCHSPICVLLSIFNLDLGFETCFYRSMTSYTKTCLQLLFPSYLIVIGLALIMGSRFSTKIQRITAQRGLPVLATLFLLSYTKVLSMVCNVLFYYTKITDLPSRRNKFYWSVDTSIKLFGAKFIILFAVCLLIFGILIPFNILLLFTRLLLRFKFVNSFKTLLDPYLSPYKDKFYFWTGMQILMRAVFFGLSALSHEVSLVSESMMIGVLFSVQGVLRPFKCQLDNLKETLLLLNLLIIYVITSHNYYNNIKSSAVEYVISTTFVYFIFFIMYISLNTLCSNRIQKLKDVISSNFITRKIWRKTKSNAFELRSVSDVTFNYKEFREPLVAIIN